MTLISPPLSVYGVELDRPAGRRILAADDSLFNLRTLARFLQWAGIDDVAFARSGQDVLRLAESFRPDLIVMDTLLSGLDGVSVLRRLRADPRRRDLPIIMQSAVPSDHLRTVCFHAGATDMIGKPINPGELIARVRYHLERRALMDELQSFRRRIEKDLAQARALQLAIAPEPQALATLGRAAGVTIDGAFHSSDEIGGDLWTAFPVGPGRVGLFVADLSGHGIAAAINAFRLHTLISRAPAEDLAEPVRLLTHLNGRLREILPVGQYATAFYGVFDRESDTLRYAAAGAPSPLLRVADEADFQPLDGSGLFLGAFDAVEYDEIEAAFPPGATLLLCSDGLTEARDAADKMPGWPGVAALAVNAERASPTCPASALMADFLKAYGPAPADDLTAVWVRRENG
jgi:phosphoserine phosphatase RsbU/P